MSDLDLTEALRAGTERLRLAGHEPADQLAGAVLLGAAPVIERQVRERIANDIRHLAAAWVVGWDDDDEPHLDVKYGAYREAWTEAGQRLTAEAARIAQGGVHTDE